MMRNKIINICLIFIILIIISIPNISNAVITRHKYDYTIEEYHINMVVNEDNTFDITETITTNFNISKHGIFRKIPLKNTIKRLDGTNSKNTAQITNIKVSEKFKTSNENGYKVIKIGDASKTLIGTHIYIIKYTYNIGKDPLKKADELYFNLIGSEWDTTIDNISFDIKMPKEFDKSLLGFSTGEVGSTYNSNISYTVNGNVINGKVIDKLNPGEALTVRLELPNKYFVGAGHKIDMFSVIIIVLCVVTVVIAYKMCAEDDKEPEVIETVEFYPPEGYNSAEIGYLYKGNTDGESVLSLLIYLADKGYIKIEETEDIEAFSEDEKIMKIIKLKEYDGDNDNEREFFNGLFSMSGSILEKAENIQEQEELKGNEITWDEAKERAKEDTRTYVTTLELENEFYSTINNIEENIEKEYKDKIIKKETKRKNKWLIIFNIVIYILITVRPILEYYGMPEGIGMLMFALIFPGVGFSVLYFMVFGTANTTIYVNGKPSKSAMAPKIFGLVWGGMFGGMPWLLIVLPALLQNKFYLVSYIIGVICIVISIRFFNDMPKRTKFGAEILGKLRGFKRFLETAEKEQLESFVMENPEYFYNILPYTYALGVSDKWINKFEKIVLQQPNWYNSNSTNGFDIDTFSKSINSTIHSMRNITTSSSSSGGSSGSSSGGGSSGGGSGGGGGGSW